MHINYTDIDMGAGGGDRISIEEKNCETRGASHRRTRCNPFTDCIFLKQLINNPSTISPSGDFQVILDEDRERIKANGRGEGDGRGCEREIKEYSSIL